MLSFLRIIVLLPIDKFAAPVLDLSCVQEIVISLNKGGDGGLQNRHYKNSGRQWCGILASIWKWHRGFCAAPACSEVPWWNSIERKVRLDWLLKGSHFTRVELQPHLGAPRDAIHWPLFSLFASPLPMSFLAPISLLNFLLNRAYWYTIVHYPKIKTIEWLTKIKNNKTSLMHLVALC